MSNKFDWYRYYLENNAEDLFNIRLTADANLAIIGDIHEQSVLFFKLMNELKKIPNLTVVSLGDIYDKGEGVEAGNTIYRHLQQNNCRILMGNHEMKKVRKKDNSVPWEELKLLPHVLSFVFPSNYRVTTIHGGIAPNFTWDSLKYNDQVLYIRDLDDDGKMIKLNWFEENGQKVLKPIKENGEDWHEWYDRRFGFVVCGHKEQKNGNPKHWRYSMNIDTTAYESGILTAAIFNQFGFQKFIQVSHA